MYASYHKRDKVLCKTPKTFPMVLTEAARCLSFKYLYIDAFYDDGYDASIVFKYRNSAGTESTLFTIGTTDVSYNSWQTKSLDVPAVSGLQV